MPAGIVDRVIEPAKSFRHCGERRESTPAEESASARRVGRGPQPRSDRTYWALQLVGGQIGVTALAIGAVRERANRTDASKNSAFFTVNLLVEVGVAP